MKTTVNALCKLTLFVLLLPFYSNLHSQKIERLGLISELSYMKANAEQLALRVLNSDELIESDIIRFTNEYNQLKNSLDQAILQLSADMKRKNSIKYYRRIDKFLFQYEINDITPTEVRPMKVCRYLGAIKNSDAQFQKLMSFKISGDDEHDPKELLSMKGFLPAAASLAELTAIASLINESIYKAAERREKKVEQISKLLNEQRLKDVQQLIIKNSESKQEDIARR